MLLAQSKWADVAPKYLAIREPNHCRGEKPHFGAHFWGDGAHTLHFSGSIFKFSDTGVIFCLEEGVLLHHFKFEMEFLAAKDHRQVELPKLAREAKRWPSLIEIHNELKAQCAPQICKTDVSRDRLELC